MLIAQFQNYFRRTSCQGQVYGGLNLVGCPTLNQRFRELTGQKVLKSKGNFTVYLFGEKVRFVSKLKGGGVYV